MSRSHVALICLLAGCGASYAEAPMLPASGPVSATDVTEIPMRGARLDTSGGEAMVDGRKLVRTGNLSVSVDEWEPFEADLQVWLAAHGGFVSEVSVNRWEGHVGSAHLTVRVPADGMDPLVSWAQEKVEVTSLSLRAEDVTAKWVDVEARLNALRTTESRLLEITAVRTATLADVLAAERELGRIRGDIESFEAQQRALTDQVSLASLTVSVDVRAPYSSIVDEAFGNQAARTWRSSIGAMGAVARGLALLVVAAAPWLLVLFSGIAAFGGGLYAFVRRS